MNGTLCSHFQALDPPYFPEFYFISNLFTSSDGIFNHFLILFPHSSVTRVLPLCAALLQNSMTAKIFFPPLLCSSCHLVFYKHNMYRNSTQTNVFKLFFFISKYNSFFMSLKQSTRASHIHTQWIFFGVFLFFVFFFSLIIQIIRLRCKFWRFSHTKRTQFEQGASGLACTPHVQGPLTCLHVYLWASCGAPACFRFTCRTECVLNGIYMSRSGATPLARSLLWYLHRNKDGGRGVWGRGGGERFKVGSKGHRGGGGGRRGGVWVMHFKFDSSCVNDNDP